LTKKIASIDVGEKRIGLAIHLCGITIPQEPVFRKNRNQASSEIKKFLLDNEIDLIVVGIPNGKNRDINQKKITHFIELVEFDGEVIYQDEDFSSFEAKESTKGKMRHKKNGKLDSISAKIILDRYLENS
jgi:putative Holliday junction resolvase